MSKGCDLSLFTKGRWAEVCDKRHVRPLTRRFVTISSVVISWYFFFNEQIVFSANSRGSTVCDSTMDSLLKFLDISKDSSEECRQFIFYLFIF